MIVDIKKIAEDEENVCYRSESGTSPANLYLVSKGDLAISVIVTGDQKTMAGTLSKLKRSLTTNYFPDFISLATG